MINEEIKKENLVELFKIYEKVIIAFSGGVDSTFMLRTAKETLGDKVVAVTLDAPVFPSDETEFARMFCIDNNIEHYVIHVDLLNHEEFTENHENRCYTCKKLLFNDVLALADELGIINVCEGSIADDDDDYRPGKQAIKELGVLSPMKEVGLTKNEIRKLSRQINLPTWDKPSMACLASRIPYGDPIDISKLKVIEESEKILKSKGFTQIRVRHHGNIARIEVSKDEFYKFADPQFAYEIEKKLKNLGFTYVTLDLGGYETGKLNVNISEVNFEENQT